MNYSAQLPHGYKSWMQLYTELVKDGEFDRDDSCDITFSVFNNLLSNHYKFSKDFIKAHCFEEISKFDFSVNELDRIIHGLMYVYNPTGEPDTLIEKLHQCINHKYDLAIY